MSTRPLTLEGFVDKGESDEMRQLRRQNQRLDEELRNIRNELGQAQAEKANLERGLRVLRTQLSPLHRALRAVFGEIELAIGEEELCPPGSSPVVSAPSASHAVWESWKNKLGGKQAAFIQALLDHGEMTAVQLKVATHSGSSTVSETVRKLQDLGLVQKNGSQYSLKKL